MVQAPGKIPTSSGNQFLIFHYIPIKSSKRTKHDGNFQKATYLCHCLATTWGSLSQFRKAEFRVS